MKGPIKDIQKLHGIFRDFFIEVFYVICSVFLGPSIGLSCLLLSLLLIYGLVLSLLGLKSPQNDTFVHFGEGPYYSFMAQYRPFWA